jgi:hypothetical protein
MKRLKLFLILPLILSLFLFGDTTGVLTATPQNFTTSWVDLGSEIDVGTKGFRIIHFWFEMEINDSNDMRFQILDKTTTTTTNEYNRGTFSTTASKLLIEPTFYEFNVDGDAKYHLVFGLDNKIDTIQVQIQVSVEGATKAQMMTAYYSLGY